MIIPGERGSKCLACARAFHKTHFTTFGCCVCGVRNSVSLLVRCMCRCLADFNDLKNSWLGLEVELIILCVPFCTFAVNVTQDWKSSSKIVFMRAHHTHPPWLWDYTCKSMILYAEALTFWFAFLFLEEPAMSPRDAPQLSTPHLFVWAWPAILQNVGVSISSKSLKF